MDLNRDLTGMSVLSGIFQKTRVLVAFALLFSVSAPLVQYACGVTGETTTASTLVAETAGTDAVPCGTVSDDVHDRLCEPSPPTPVCDGDACTTDSVEKQSVVHSEISPRQPPLVLTAGDLPSDGDTSPNPLISSRLASGSDWRARASNRIPVRFWTLSFRL